MSFRNLVLRLRRRLVQALVLIEQIHLVLHGLHGCQQSLCPLFRRSGSRAGQQLLGRKREHHGIQKDIRRAQNTVRLGVSVIHMSVSAVLMHLGMLILHLAYKRIQSFHIGRRTPQPLCLIRHPVQIQPGYLYAAADPDSVSVICTAVPRILDVQRAPGFYACGTGYFRHGDLVGSYFQRPHYLAHRCRL